MHKTNHPNPDFGSVFCPFLFFVVARMLTKRRCFFFGVAMQKTWNPSVHDGTTKKRILVVVDLVAGFKSPFAQTHASKQKGSSYLPQDSAKPKTNKTTQFTISFTTNIKLTNSKSIEHLLNLTKMDIHFLYSPSPRTDATITWKWTWEHHRNKIFWFQSSWGRCALLKPHTPGTSPVTGYSENGVCCLSSELLLPRCNLVDGFKKSSVRLEQNSLGKLTKVQPQNGRMKRLLKACFLKKIMFLGTFAPECWHKVNVTLLHVNCTGSGRKIGHMFVDCLHLRLEGIF